MLSRILCVWLLLLLAPPAMAQRREVHIRGKDAATLEQRAAERGKTVDETLQEELDRTLDRLALETLANQLDVLRLHLLSLTPEERAVFVQRLQAAPAVAASWTAASTTQRSRTSAWGTPRGSASPNGRESAPLCGG